MTYAYRKRIEAENRAYFARLRGEDAEFEVCPQCHGDGDAEVPCAPCKGSGQIIGECEHCGSWTDLDCKRCDGTGVKYAVCSRCGGAGYTQKGTEPRPPQPSNVIPLFDEKETPCADE
jgi:RecJ-like exonuclease